MPQKPPIEFDAQQLLYAVVNAAVGNGLAPEGEVDFARERGNKPLVVVAAAPKSGSTFLANTLRVFGIRPIILVRRIEDIVVSLQHDLKRKADRPTIGTGQEGYSFVWQDQCTSGLSDERLIDMIIDLAVPWFVNFYVSWYRLCEQRAIDALWVTYEQLFAEKERTLRQVLEFLGFAGIPEIDSETLSRKYPTFRDGSIGQGAAVLTAEQGSRIRDRVSYCPEVDFGKYGL